MMALTSLVSKESDVTDIEDGWQILCEWRKEISGNWYSNQVVAACDRQDALQL
jgi:hypothetical protein